MTDDREITAVEKAVVLVILIGAVLAIAFCSSCATIEAVTNAPEDFWITLDDIVAALLSDIWQIIDLFL